MLELYAVNDRGLDPFGIQQDVVHRFSDLVPDEADATRRVALRIAIDEQDALFRRGQGGGEVHGGGGLSDSTFLIGNSDDAGH